MRRMVVEGKILNTRRSRTGDDMERGIKQVAHATDSDMERGISQRAHETLTRSQNTDLSWVCLPPPVKADD